MKKSALTAVKTQVIYLDLGWTEGNFADIVGVPRKKRDLLPSIPLRKMQNSSFAPAKPSQSTQGLSLKAVKRIHARTMLPPCQRGFV